MIVDNGGSGDSVDTQKVSWWQHKEYMRSESQYFNRYSGWQESQINNTSFGTYICCFIYKSKPKTSIKLEIY